MRTFRFILILSALGAFIPPASATLPTHTFTATFSYTCTPIPSQPVSCTRTFTHTPTKPVTLVPTLPVTYTHTATPTSTHNIPAGCTVIEVKGLENCAHGGPDLEPSVAVKVPVVQGQNYVIRRISGAISYGQLPDANGVGFPLYGTRLRVFKADDASGAGITMAGYVGYASYAMGQTRKTAAEAEAQSVPYDAVTLTASGHYFFFTPDDIYGGYCLDNIGSEFVQICGNGVTIVPTQPVSFTHTLTGTPTSTKPVSIVPTLSVTCTFTPSSTMPVTILPTPAVTFSPTFTLTPGLIGACRMFEVKGKENCVDNEYSAANTAAVAVPIPVVPGRTYRFTLKSGCISYGWNHMVPPAGSHLYGTRLRIFRSDDTTGTHLGLSSTIGNGSYRQGGGCSVTTAIANGNLFLTCEEAWASLAAKPSLQTVVLKADSPFFMLETDDIYYGYCGDNTGSEFVEVCETNDSPTTLVTPLTSTFTSTPTRTPTSTPVTAVMTPVFTSTSTATVTASPTPFMGMTATCTPTSTHPKCLHPVPYPNPCRGDKVFFRVGDGPYDNVTIDICTVGSRRVRRISRPVMGESDEEFIWNLKDHVGRMVSNGLYQVVIETHRGGQTKRFTEKVVVLR